jgi:hypothetical protein
MFRKRNSKIEILAVLIGIMTLNLAVAQNKHFTRRIDTLAIQHDSTLANIQEFRDGKLLCDKTAFLVPDTIVVTRFGFLPIKKTVYCSRVIRHGKTIYYSSGDKKAIATYKYGKLLKTDYYSNSSTQVPDSTKANESLIGPCSVEIIPQDRRSNKHSR